MRTRIPAIAALALLLTLSALAPSPAAAQEPTAGQGTDGVFQGEVTVKEVLLDVLVTDRQGNVIVGLDREDFIVKEDGQEIPVESVTFYSNRALLDPLNETAPELGDIDTTPQNRYFVLFFEEQKRRSFDDPRALRRAFEAARDSKRFVEQGLLLDDYVAVLSYDTKLKIHQDFTQDKELVVRAIDAAAQGKDAGDNWPSRIPETEGPSLRARLPQGKALSNSTESIYDALQVVARAAGPIIGRKNLVLYSTGFGRITEFGLYKPDSRYFDPTMQALNNNNVAVYTLDLVAPGVDHTQAGALNQIADETGGRYFFNVNNFGTPLQQLAEENSGYYLVSYRARHPADSAGFQEVEVATLNPEFRVKAREGYLYGDSGNVGGSGAAGGSAEE